MRGMVAWVARFESRSWTFVEGSPTNGHGGTHLEDLGECAWKKDNQEN